MRTKALILSAALVAAGVASSMAQSNVYSLNVVGYTTVSLTNGFNLISNPLDLDGTGHNNTITTAFGSQLPSGTQVYKFSGGAFTANDLYFTGPGWLGGGTITLNPGEGLFVNSPSATNITFTGTVLQGNLTNNYIAGFNIISSQIPLAGGVSTALSYPPNNNDQLYVWNPAAQGYSSSYLYITGPGWLPSEPSFNVGDAWFLSTGGGAGSWTTNFTVH